MNNKGNQKHLTFEQRVDIEKGLTENKSFAEIARIIGGDTVTELTLQNAREMLTIAQNLTLNS